MKIILAFAMIWLTFPKLCIACEGPDFVLLGGSQVKNLRSFCSRPGLLGKVHPAEASCIDVRNAEGKLPEFLSRPSVNGLLQDFHNGFRQYIAFKRKGQRFLFINRVPKDNQVPHHVSVRSVRDMCDGGRGVWSVEYNISTGKFENLTVSGPAAYPDNSPPPFSNAK